MSQKYKIGSILLIICSGLMFAILTMAQESRWAKLGPIALILIGVLVLSTTLILPRLAGQKRADSFFTNVTIFMIAFVLLLIVGELLFRFWFDDVTTTAEGGGYFDKSWYEETQVNQWGFRERDFQLDKPDEVYRIAVIGDSITYGQGVGEDKRFTNLLEQQLNRTGQKYEVLNFGIPGAETVDHVQFLKEPVLQADPDFVLLQWYTNDVETRDKSGRPQPRSFIPVKLREASALFTVLHGQLNRLQNELGLVRSYEDYMFSLYGDPNSRMSISAQTKLQAFVDLTQDAGIPLGIVLYASNDKLVYLADRVLALCQQEEITCMHLGDMFEEYKDDPMQLWSSRFDPHPGILAHQLIADRIYATFGPAWQAGQPQQLEMEASVDG